MAFYAPSTTKVIPGRLKRYPKYKLKNQIQYLHLVVKGLRSELIRINYAGYMKPGPGRQSHCTWRPHSADTGPAHLVVNKGLLSIINYAGYMKPGPGKGQCTWRPHSANTGPAWRRRQRPHNKWQTRPGQAKPSPPLGGRPPGGEGRGQGPGTAP